MRAVIGDIHGNLEALDAVCNQIGTIPILCLGDVTCYGPDSVECVRRSASWSKVIAGRFDLALLNSNFSQYNQTLAKSIAATRKQLESAEDSKSLLDTLQNYGPEFSEYGRCFFHGTPGDVEDWIFPEDSYTNKLNRYLHRPENIFIGAGSHIPGIFRFENGVWKFTEPVDGIVYELPSDFTTIITIGSVGQPRDNDYRAAFAFLDDVLEQGSSAPPGWPPGSTSCRRTSRSSSSTRHRAWSSATP